MGMFDYVKALHPGFVCSEGHDLRGEEFQSKDFDCVLGQVEIGDTLIGHDWGLGDPLAGMRQPIVGAFDMGCTCRQCPAFVQAGTFNVIGTSVDFSVVVEDGHVTKVLRTSPSTAEFLESEPRQCWMFDARGPMSHEDARKRAADRKFFPWDPTPPISAEVRSAQEQWRKDCDERQAKYAAMREKDAK